MPQYIRAGAIIQLLLGNIGRPGGGVLALRGHASIQGSTDVPTLFNLLPGYLRDAGCGHEPPARLPRHECAATTRRASGATPTRTWCRCSRSTGASAATAENDFCFDYLPRINGDHGTYRTVMDMVDGKVFGYFLLGQNPAVGSAHGRLQRLGMANLDWLVVRDLAMIESATFWKDAPEVETGEIVPEKLPDRGVLLPGAPRTWRRRAPSPRPSGCCSGGTRRSSRPATQRSELWFFYHLGPHAAGEAGRLDRRAGPAAAGPVRGTTRSEGDEPSAEDVLRRINGVDLRTGRAVDGYLDLKADGSTIVRVLDLQRGVRRRGQPGRRGANRTTSRAPTSPSGAGPGRWTGGCSTTARRPTRRAAPGASARSSSGGTPNKGEWTGHDVPDFEENKPPDYRPPRGRGGCRGAARGRPVHHAGRRQGLAVRAQRPARTARCRRTTSRTSRRCATRCTAQQGNPVRKVYGRPDNPSNPSPPEAHGEVFPFVFTAARLTEHHTAGGDEPAAAVPVGAAAGAVRGGVAGAGGAARAGHLDWAHVITSRTAVEARVLVTDRMAPLRVEGRVVHQVWMPYHWGQIGLVDR